MTNEDLKTDWQLYGVEVQGQFIRLKDRYMVCWGWVEDLGGLIFDEGGPMGATAHVLKTDDQDNLISVNPGDPQDTLVLGKLVLLPNEES